MAKPAHVKIFQKLDSSQHDMIKLHHAQSCKRSSEDCVVPGCAFFKGLNFHLGPPNAPYCTGCDLPRCRELNGYLSHFRKCSDQRTCPYCSGILKVGFRRRPEYEPDRKKRAAEVVAERTKRLHAEVIAADALALLAAP